MHVDVYIGVMSEISEPSDWFDWVLFCAVRLVMMILGAIYIFFMYVCVYVCMYVCNMNLGYTCPTQRCEFKWPWVTEWQQNFQWHGASCDSWTSCKTNKKYRKAVWQLVKEENDLGVTVSAGMKWERQCIEAVKKANIVLGLIKRNFQDKSKYTFMPLYKSLVRPPLRILLSRMESIS